VCHLQVLEAAVVIKAERVHHSGELALEPGGHDLVEQFERHRAGVEIVLATSCHRAQAI